MSTALRDDAGDRLRILQVIGNAIVGGMETFVARLCEQMIRSQAFDVVCLCPYESAATHALRGLGCTVRVAPLPDEPVWRGIEYAAALVADEGIDVIHAHLTNAHLLAGIVGKLTGTPVLATIHGRDVPTADIAMQRMAGSHLHVVSHATLYQALGAGVRRDRISCIINGVDAERFAPGVSTGALRRDLDIPGDAPLIGFVGRLSHEKGPDLFVRAAAAVLIRRPDVHAVLIGGGAMLPALRALAVELGVATRLHFAGVRSDIPDCLRAFSIVVSSSRSEGTPLAIMEAQATGAPVVATHVGGLPEIVTMGETGVLVPPGEADSIAEVVVALLGNPADLARLGTAARQRMLERFALSDRNAEVTRLATSLVRATPAILQPTRRAALTSVHGNDAKLRNTTTAKAPRDGA